MTSRNRPAHRPVDLAKRQAVLDAAKEEFLLHGFSAASIEAIASKAGVSKVTVYNQFGGKERLLTEIVQRECLAMGVALGDRFPDRGDLRDQLITFGITMLAFLKQPHIIRFEHMIAREAEARPEIGQLFLEAGPFRVRGALAELFERAVAAGEMKPCDSLDAASQFYGMICGFDIVNARFSVDHRGNEYDHARVNQVVDRFLTLFGA